MVPFFSRNYNKKSIDRVVEVINSGFLTSGAVGKSVEGQIAEYFTVKYCTLVNSWTSAWDLVLDFHNIGPGDEVLMPSMTFVSCANSVVRRGASVVFCDIEPDTLLVSSDTLKPHVTDKTKIILVVHLYGLMVDVNSIRSSFPSIPIYEDSAHCFEGQFDGSRPGQFSDGAMFSFYATKNISCGEGGALVTNNETLDSFSKTQRLHGMDKSAIDRYQAKSYVHWDVRNPGFKFNLPDLLSALLPEQIANADFELQWRQELYRAYCDGLDRLIAKGCLRIQYVPPGVIHAHHLFPICVQPNLRDDLLSWLTSNDIGVAVNFRDIPSLEYYKFSPRPSNARRWGEGAITLPFHKAVNRQDVRFIVNKIREFYKE